MAAEKGPIQLTVPEVVRAMNVLYTTEIQPLERILTDLQEKKREAEDALSDADSAFETAEGDAIAHVQERLASLRYRIAQLDVQIEKVSEAKRPYDTKHAEFEKLYQSIVQSTDTKPQS